MYVCIYIYIVTSHWTRIFAAAIFILDWCRVKHQDLVNLKIWLRVFSILSWAEITTGTTEQSKTNWTMSVVFLERKMSVMSVLIGSLISFLSYSILKRTSRELERAGQSIRRCSSDPGKVSSHVRQLPDFVGSKCLSSMSLLYFPDTILA